MKLAHSLNIPHYNILLRQLSAYEYEELMLYFEAENDRRNNRRAIAEEEAVRDFFKANIARQKAGKA